jgi:hypothetical protein
VERDKKDWSASFKLELPSAKIKAGPVEVSTGKRTIDIKWSPQDEKLGEDDVIYCDEADGDGQLYSTGSIRFRVTEELD